MLTAMKKVFLVLFLVWTSATITRALECNYNSDPDYFSCTERGIFPNYNDETCSTFYSCLKTSNGFLKYLRTCSPDTYFDRNKNKCDWTYKCPCNNEESFTSDLGLLAADESSCIEDSTVTFDCSTVTKSGCYSDPSDPYCEKYINCYITASGKVYQQSKTCPPGTFFNASSDACGCSISNLCSCRRF